MSNALVKIEDFRPVKIPIRQYFAAKSIEGKYALQAYDAFLQGQLDLFRLRLQAFMNWQRDELLLEGQRVLFERKNNACASMIEQVDRLLSDSTVRDPYRKELLSRALNLNVEAYISAISQIGVKNATSRQLS